jgi:2'-5' RNA ligase
MPRLFVAIGLPDAVATEVARIRPPRTPGVRLTEPGQMHVTLHFLGEADVERTAAALRSVTVASFRLDLAGVGQFPSADGAVTLWAGVREGPELLALHTAVAAALAGEGFRPEVRPFAPHITLARCEGEAARFADEFLAQHAGFSLPGVPVEKFGLYSSERFDGVPAYRREFSVPHDGWPSRSDRLIEA